MDLDPGSFRRAMLAYARGSPAYRRLVASTLGELRELLERHGDEAYVAYSGGKDSLVLLHLAARVRPEVRVFHWDHGPWLMPREVEEEILEAARRVAPGARLRVETSRRLWEEAARWDHKRWYRAFWATLERLASEGWRVALLGIRRGESVSRRLRAGRQCRETRVQVECYPLRYWGWRDVWAYIFEHGLPYPRVYDELCPVVGWDRCRLVTFFDEEFRHLEGNIHGVIFWRWRHRAV